MALNENATTTTEIEDTFAKVIRDTVFDGRDLVLIEPYNGPRPQQAYATVHLNTAKGYEHEIRHRYINENGEYTEFILGTHWCRIIIQIFGGEAIGRGIKIRNKLKSSLREFDLFRKIGFGQIGEVSDISSEYQAKFEDRARLTVDFYAMISDENKITDIGHVYGDINGEVPFEIDYP